MTASSTAIGDVSAFDTVMQAALVTTDVLERALLELEIGRAQYDDSHTRGATRIARLATELGRADLEMRARMVLADINLRAGAVLHAAETLMILRSDAEQAGDAYALARSNFLLSSAQFALGDVPNAQISGIRGVEILPQEAPAQIRIDHLCGLAVAYGPGADSEQCMTYALDLATVIGDVDRTINIYNGWCYLGVRADDIAAATHHFDQLLELSSLREVPLNDAELDTVARIYMMTGRCEKAVTLLQRLPAKAADILAGRSILSMDRRPYALPEGLLTLAAAHREQGRFVAARRTLGTARQIMQQRGLRELHARTLEEEAQLQADLGDFRGAFASHIAFHDAMVALRSAEQEARARLVQAAYDEEERQRDAEQFRDLAMRDALTGLYNRRYLDEQLRALAGTAQRQRTPLSVAIADADLFKRINDRLSHHIGDQVLQALAAILAGQVRQPHVVGRLGGEEFAILMPQLGAADATDKCERIRHAIADYDWQRLTADLPVTVSIGVTTAPRGHTSPTQLLAAADKNLYAAKRSGRNRVMGDALE